MLESWDFTVQKRVMSKKVMLESWDFTVQKRVMSKRKDERNQTDWRDECADAVGGGVMGRVSAFAGIVLYMYPEAGGKHKRPHLHAVYGDDECELSIPEGDVLAGALPPKQLRNVQTFIDMREKELMLDWDLCMKGQDVIWIDPIR